MSDHSQISIVIAFIHEQFSEYEFFAYYDKSFFKWCLIVSNYDLYKSEYFNQVIKFLREETDVKFFCAYCSLNKSKYALQYTIEENNIL